MAIINRYIQQAAGVDNITLADLEDNHFTAGLYKLEEPISLYKSNEDENTFCVGDQIGFSFYKEYDNCSIIANSDVIHENVAHPTRYSPTTQILIPYNNTDAVIDSMFIRFNNDSGAWSNLIKIQTGGSVKSVKDEDGYHLVDNTDPLNPVVLSDRTKLDKVHNFTFTGGANYKPGDIIETSESPEINAYVVEVDPNTGEITKLELTTEPTTDTDGFGAEVQVNTEVEGSLAEFDEFGNLRPSAFKGSYVKPYEFSFRHLYVYELDFDETYDNSDLAGGSSDYGFAYAPFSFANFEYSLIDKATNESLTGTIDFNHKKPMYIPAVNPGTLIWYGYVNSDKVIADESGATGYKDGDTFEFEINRDEKYQGTIVSTAQSPWTITTTLPNDIGAVVNGVYETKTLTGEGTGLKVYVTPSVVAPCNSLGVKDIPDRSLVWSGVKAKIKESNTRVGTIIIPFEFNFDIMVAGVRTHVVEYNELTVVGLYGIRPAWVSSNYNTVTPNSTVAEGWQNGDEFTVEILGTTYNGVIDDISTEPYTLHTDIPQTTDLTMTGVYTAIPKKPAEGKGLLIDVNTVASYTYKLNNVYVDPHGGHDPAFYANSQVDILLARQRVQAGTEDNIMAFAGQEGKFKELLRKTEMSSDPSKRSDYALLTEKAVGDYIDDKIDRDSIASMSSEWIATGEQLNLNKASGETASSVLIPYASDTQDGLLKKDLYNQLNVDHSTLQALQGLESIAAELGESPIDQAKLKEEWEAAGKTWPPGIGSKIINVSEGNNQGHNWVYLEMGGVTQWYDIGSGNVAVATNSLQGVVMGTEPSTSYSYYTSIVKQSGAAGNFVNEVLTTNAAGAEGFTVTIKNVDSEGNITACELSPASGADKKMLSNVPFTKSHGEALYYTTTYEIDDTVAQGYVNQESFSITGLDDYSGYVLNSTVDPLLCITNIPSKTETDISGEYETVSLNGKGTGLKIVVTSTPYYESVTLRVDITSWEDPCDTIEITDYQGHMKASGVGTLAEHVKFLYENKADNNSVDITSNDGTITIKKPEGFENSPRFDLSFNLAASTTWITLTPLLDGVTSEWDLTPYLQGVSTSDLEFYYGDGILFSGIDYLFNSNVKILAPGIGYEVGDIIMLNNDTRSARIESVDEQGKILAASLSTALPSTTKGTGADVAAQFIFKSLKDPLMNSASNRTFMCKGTKLSLISDLSGITNIVDPTGTINTSVSNNIATIGLNVNNVFRANSSQPCYITLTTPTEAQNILTQGSLINIIQGLANNMRYVLDHAVWKYNADAPRIEIAIQDEPIEPRDGYDVLRISPKDLGQIADWHEN